MKTKLISSVLAIIVILVLGGLFLLGQPSKVLTQDAAANAVIAQYPNLGVYRTISLPPSFIEGKYNENGWYIAFIQRGSGVPGILNASCFYVNDEKTVTALGQYVRSGNAVDTAIDFKTCAPTGQQGVHSSILPYGSVELAIGERATFENISIRPIEVIEDSRCPIDVQCIQAGTVRIKIEIVSGIGTSTSIVKLSNEFTVESIRITLSAVAPTKHSQTQVTTGDYRLTFNVTPRSAPVSAKCYVGGCSAQLCTSQPDAVSTCEYTASYACYKSAKCERQTSGQCGWTSTPELSACLSNS